MKRTRIIAFMLAALLTAALTGCQSGPRQSPGSTPDTSSDISPEPSPSPSPDPSQQLSQAPSPEPSAAPPSETSPEPGSSESPTAQAADVTVYYLKFGILGFGLVRETHTLPECEDAARAALDELISGTPTTEDAYRALPADTEILGFSIENGLATVDFSKQVLDADLGPAEKRLGIASIVNTLTEFETIGQVALTVEGSAENGMDWWGRVGLPEQPFSRDLGMVYEPAIWVTAPAAGDKAASPLRLRGSAMGYEASGVRYRLKDADGNILAEGIAALDAGGALRGDFDVSVSFDPTAAGQGQVEVFDEDVRDGSEIHKVIIPVTW
jgi:germination protein M